jgi:hypothetical protein
MKKYLLGMKKKIANFSFHTLGYEKVEMESLQFVGCSWFIGLIGLGFGFTQNKSISNEMCVSVPLPRLL